MTSEYSVIVALASVAQAGYLVLRRMIRPADPKETGHLFASLSDEEQKAVLARMRTLAKKKYGKRG